MYEHKQRYENLHHGFFTGTGRYGIPVLNGTSRTEFPELVSFNYARTASGKEEKGVHFFIDDYQFARVWNRPTDYLALLSKYKVVFAPDFSLYSDIPEAMQIYNHYRKHWCAAYWELNGIEVVPTICWSGEKSFEWCFDGDPIGGTVAVSSVGTQRSREAKAAFLRGYNEMMKRLKPLAVVFYGSVPNECEGNIIHIDAFQNKFDKKVVR